MTRKPQLLTQALVGFAFAIGATVTFSQPSHARDTFFCGMSNGQPATIVRNSKWENIPMIRWVDDSFPPPWKPTRRCEEISARFQRFLDNGLLRYLKGGWLNGQPVLCVAAYKGGPCLPNGLIVTLKPDSNPERILNALLDYRNHAGGFIDLRSGLLSTVDGELYFNIGDFLTELSEEESTMPNLEELPPGPLWDW
jgi:hypothetical protein